MSYRLDLADAHDWLKTLPDSSSDALLSDPPYGLEFMGREWDKVVPSVDVWREAYRVLKPGAYGLVFGGTRTFHRLAVSLEDAGFELRDTLMWVYAQGFPKSQNLSLAIDKAAGATREVVGTKRAGIGRNSRGVALESEKRVSVTAPATPDAERWQGYGSALKPAYEPILLVRKPPEKNNVHNALKHGCGGLNIDDARIAVVGDAPKGSGRRESWRKAEGRTDAQPWNGGNVTPESGRFPANVILDEDAAALLNAQTGVLKSNSGKAFNRNTDKFRKTYSAFEGGRAEAGFYGDEGGASRFFYVAKASRADRDFGLSQPNEHPTVKPLTLARYLAKLLLVPARDTPRQLLAPFAGSGTEMMGALSAGWDEVLGCEFSLEYHDLATRRLDAISRQPALNFTPTQEAQP